MTRPDQNRELYHFLQLAAYLEGGLIALEHGMTDRGDVAVMEQALQSAADLHQRLRLLTDSTKPQEFEAQRPGVVAMFEKSLFVRKES